MIGASKKQWLACLGVGAAGFHLFLAAYAMAGGDFARFGAFGRALDEYAFLTVTKSTYAFFAPSVGSEARILFTIESPEHPPETINFLDRLSNEGKVRLGNLFQSVVRDIEDDQVRHALLASWAAYMFGIHPSASRVGVTVQVYQVPTTAEYRAGRRGGWKPVYQVSYERHASNP